MNAIIHGYATHECSECDGSGYSKQYKYLEKKWFSWDKEDWKPNPYRDGSFDYYMSEPIRANDAKGVGPFILAAHYLNK